jgi:predicted nucleotidyltransferase
MTETQLVALEKTFRDLPEIGVVSAYLFGSHAAGRAHRESDIDVAVLLDERVQPTPRDRLEVRVRLGSELIARLDHNDIDLVILNEAPPLFARHVVLDGRPVFVSDAAADFDYRLKVQLLAADLATSRSTTTSSSRCSPFASW